MWPYKKMPRLLVYHCAKNHEKLLTHSFTVILSYFYGDWWPWTSILTLNVTLHIKMPFLFVHHCVKFLQKLLTRVFFIYIILLSNKYLCDLELTNWPWLCACRKMHLLFTFFFCYVSSKSIKPLFLYEFYKELLKNWPLTLTFDLDFDSDHAKHATSI
jgi:hypothetical protein